MLTTPHINGRTYDILRTRALRLTRDHDRAHDLVQDTLERCLRRRPQDLAADKTLPWLLVVMRRLFLDAVRAPRSRWLPLNADDPRLFVSAEPEPPPPWHAFHQDDVDALLNAMPMSLRRPYEMHAVDELSYRRIAAVLGINVRTVGTRIFRARRYLRCALLHRSLLPQGPGGYS